MAEQPRFLSLDFHLRFLPGVIARQWRGRREPRTGFVATGSVVLLLAVMVCAMLLASGLSGVIEPPQPEQGSVMLCIAGASGLGAIATLSLWAARGEPLSWEAFDAGFFLFLIALGATAGLWYEILNEPDRNAGIQWRESHALARFLWAAGGAAAGYLLGIPAALWAQRLGPIGVFIRVFAIPGVVGLIVVDVVILSL